MTMASFEIEFLQTEQMYEQFSQTGDPSESKSRLVSCSTRFRHFAHLKLDWRSIEGQGMHECMCDRGEEVDGQDTQGERVKW